MEDDGELFSYEINIYFNDRIETHIFNLPKQLYEHLISLEYATMDYVEQIKEMEEEVLRLNSLMRGNLDGTFASEEERLN